MAPDERNVLPDGNRGNVGLPPNSEEIDVRHMLWWGSIDQQPNQNEDGDVTPTHRAGHNQRATGSRTPNDFFEDESNGNDQAQDDDLTSTNGNKDESMKCINEIHSQMDQISDAPLILKAQTLRDSFIQAYIGARKMQAQKMDIFKMAQGNTKLLREYVSRPEHRPRTQHRA
ncbi:hypothetical protein HAX54_044225 [Datura stramonium]|uniref:Uncharacterized protein n=1 Tax=Datura stramonium TaxID=4076 RepID=A0ABS8SNX7_DATST|nr:hypothetical protein [Datura stramonium]